RSGQIRPAARHLALIHGTYGMNRPKIVVGLPVLALLTGGFAVGAMAQSAAPDAGDLDCVIEARPAGRLAGPERGSLPEIVADRGAVVKKGDPVARLNSELEAVAVEAARVKAERDVEVRSNSARYDFKKQAADRSEELYAKNIAPAKSREEAIVGLQLA